MKISLKPLHLVIIVGITIIATFAIQFFGFTAQNYIFHCIMTNYDYYPAFLNVFSVLISSLISATIALIVVHIQINSDREKNKNELQRITVTSLKIIYQELEYNNNILNNALHYLQQMPQEISVSDIYHTLEQLSDRYWVMLMSRIEFNNDSLLQNLTSAYFKLSLIRNSPKAQVSIETFDATTKFINSVLEEINTYLKENFDFN